MRLVQNSYWKSMCFGFASPQKKEFHAFLDLCSATARTVCVCVLHRHAGNKLLVRLQRLWLGVEVGRRHTGGLRRTFLRARTAKTESWQKKKVGRRWAHQWQNGTSKMLFPNVLDRAFHWGAKRFDFQKIICSLFHSQWIRKNSTIFLKDGFITMWLTWWLTCLFPTKYATENNLKTSLQLGHVPLCWQTFQTWQTYVHEILSNS